MLNYFLDPCFVYILKCSDGSYYVGHTSNLDERINAHIEGWECGYTSARRPVFLVYAKEFETRDEAFRAERQIKNWSHRKKEALVKNKSSSIKSLLVVQKAH